MAEIVRIEKVTVPGMINRYEITLTRAQVEEALKRLNESVVFKPGDLVERTGEALQSLLHRRFLVTNETPDVQGHIRVTDGVETHSWYPGYARKVGTL